MLLNIIAYFILPVYTLLFIKDSHLFNSNFSVHGNLPCNQLEFLIWGIMIGLYFYILIKRILKLIDNTKKEMIILNITGILLFMAITTPYLPSLVPFRSFLHILFAFVSALLLMVELYLIVWRLYRQNSYDFRVYLCSLHYITAISLLLLIVVGIVSTALEFFFSISCVILTCNLYKQIANLT